MGVQPQPIRCHRPSRVLPAAQRVGRTPCGAVVKRGHGCAIVDDGRTGYRVRVWQRGQRAAGAYPPPRRRRPPIYMACCVARCPSLYPVKTCHCEYVTNPLFGGRAPRSHTAGEHTLRLLPAAHRMGRPAPAPFGLPSLRLSTIRHVIAGARPSGPPSDNIAGLIGPHAVHSVLTAALRGCTPPADSPRIICYND